MEKLQTKRMLTVREAAEMLSLKETTLRDWILRRKISYHKVGKKAVRIRREVIEQLLAESEIPALRN